MASEINMVTTGGLVRLIAPETKVVDEARPWLTLHGLD